MELLTLQWLVALLIAVGLATGFILGSRRSARSRRRLERDLNRQRLEALDLTAELQSVKRQSDQVERQQRLIRLILQRLKRADASLDHLTHARVRLERQHRLEVAGLELALEEARDRARTAARLAVQASSRLKSTKGQAANSARNQPASDALAKPVTHLSDIRGIDPATERNLNAAGIHHVEQLASLTESELTELRHSLDHRGTSDCSADWIGGARKLMREQSRARSPMQVPAS